MPQPNGSSLPQASVRDTLGVTADVVVPTVSKGVIIRRPRVTRMAERLDLDRRAVRRLQKLRDRYGEGPVMLRIPGQHRAVVLTPDHVHRVLEQSPEPYATASAEKKAALSHFEPKVALISHGPERAERRRYNEEVLHSETAVHPLVAPFLKIVEEEAEAILASAEAEGILTWDDFADGWFRLVRRVVFGEGAAHDEELSRMVAELRRAANWAFLRPKRKGLRSAFFRRMNHHLERAEPASLAGVMARISATPEAAPDHQVPQWLFAFDPAGMTTFRSLALISTHPEHAESVREEIQAGLEPESHPLPQLRATVLESLRLWPTTPTVLRETTRDTEWENGVMPAGTGILIFAPFFHRDDTRLDFADRLAPELWLGEKRTSSDWPLIPFSGGPGICPGRHLVLLLTSAMLAAILRRRDLRLVRPERMDDKGRLPATLDHFSLGFHLT
jgi:cytochrome P450